MALSSAERQRKLYWKDPEKGRAYQRQWYYDNPERAILRQTKARSKREGIPFNLTLEDILIPEYCPALGIKLCGLGEKRCDATPSIDKIDPTKGYVKGNIAIISFRANRMKWDASLDELQKLTKFIESRLCP